MKYAILSTTVDEDYSFYAPLTAKLFQDVVAYKPFVILYGRPADWTKRHHQLVIDELAEGKVPVYFLGKVTGCSQVLAIKLARWFCSGLPLFKDDDYLLTSDIDLWPISYAFYNNVEPETPYHLFNADIHGFKMHAACHIGASAKNWRKLMEMEAGEDPAGKIEREVGKAFQRWPSSWEGRRSDEQFMRTWVIGHPSYPDKFQFINRGSPPEGRLDRESWPEKVETGGKVDAHLLRPGTDPRIWERVLPVIPEYLRDWASDYRERYLKARGA